eukprot:scaffold35496_cov73-Isochrysis_galbana.AAC.1
MQTSTHPNPALPTSPTACLPPPTTTKKRFPLAAATAGLDHSNLHACATVPMIYNYLHAVASPADGSPLPRGPRRHPRARGGGGLP